jgi:hypothetical protein
MFNLESDFWELIGKVAIIGSGIYTGVKIARGVYFNYISDKKSDKNPVSSYTLPEFERPVFKKYSGPIVKQLWQLTREDNRHVLGARGVVNQRNNSIDTEIQYDWWLPVLLCDGVFRHPNGNIKIALDSPIFTQYMGLGRDFKEGFIQLGSSDESSIEMYNSLDNVVAEFTKHDLKNIKLNQKLSEKEAKEHPFWQALLNYNQSALDLYVHNVFKLDREGKHNPNIMGIYLKKFNYDLNYNYKRVLGGMLRIHKFTMDEVDIERGWGAGFIGITPEALATKSLMLDVKTVTNKLNQYLDETPIFKVTKKDIENLLKVCINDYMQSKSSRNFVLLGQDLYISASI